MYKYQKRIKLIPSTEEHDDEGGGQLGTGQRNVVVGGWVGFQRDPR